MNGWIAKRARVPGPTSDGGEAGGRGGPGCGWETTNPDGEGSGLWGGHLLESGVHSGHLSEGGRDGGPPPRLKVRI